jgi:hypothetical protein
LKQFDEWKPATKVLKDVKYRLEAVRSKLWTEMTWDRREAVFRPWK